MATGGPGGDGRSVSIDGREARVQHSGVLVNPYEVFEVPETASERNEPMGSRTKFWFRRGDNPWLFKATRPNHGEDWAEVLAAELAEALDLPHAGYQLATWRGQQGVVTPTFQPDGFDLVHGNELLQPIGIETAAHLFAGYLLFDAWIGNTDRHHENWAVLLNRNDGTVHLAPTYDHAASLGSHETDEARGRRLSTRDAGFTVDAYVRRPMARSALYGDENDQHPLTMLLAYQLWVGSSATGVWVERLRLIEGRRIETLVGQVPTPPASGPARAFAAAMLKANRERILRGE
jgi:hypothetical protein